MLRGWVCTIAAVTTLVCVPVLAASGAEPDPASGQQCSKASADEVTPTADKDVLGLRVIRAATCGSSQNEPDPGARRGGRDRNRGGTAFVMPEAVPGWECVRVPGQDWGMCTWVGIDPASPGPVPEAPVVDRVRVESYVREVVGSIALPEPMIRVGPDPSVNKWDMAVVGFPLWFWTDSEGSVARTVSEYGITIELSARRDRVVFDFGDGTSLTCTAMASLPSNYDAGDPSPNCGHVFEVPSLPEGDYTVTAAGYWTFTWSALGFSGTLPGQVSATRELPVGELQAVLVPVEG